MRKEQGKKTDEYRSVFGNRPNSNQVSQGIADWQSVPEKLLVELIVTATSRGGAVRFGYTRDGGAYALGCYYGMEHKTVYCRPAESVEDFMNEWIQFYKDLPMTSGKSPT